MKITIVGDVACGKTRLLEAFNGKHYPNYASVERTYMQYKLSMFKGDFAKIVLFDFVGHADYTNERFRPILYQNTHVILLCYSIDSRKSFANVSKKWFPEVKRICPELPVVLVGLKTDLRSNNSTRSSSDELEPKFVTSAEGKKMAHSIDASAFLECSSSKGDGVKDVLETAIEVTFEDKKMLSLKRRLRRFICCFASH